MREKGSSIKNDDKTAGYIKMSLSQLKVSTWERGKGRLWRLSGWVIDKEETQKEIRGMILE